MAQLKFYKSASAPTSAAAGAIWFNSQNHTIQVKTDAGWDKYAGALNDATWDGLNLTITKHDGSSIVLNFSDFASASGVTAALASKLNIGTDGDASTVQSYYGLKKYTDEAVRLSEETIIGSDADTASDDTIHGVRKYVWSEINSFSVTSNNTDLFTVAGTSYDEREISATAKLVDAVALAETSLQATDKTELQNKIDAINVVGDNKYIAVTAGGTNGDTFTVTLSQDAENKLETSKTTVNAKADGHVIVTVTPADQSSGDIVTITESDIASAQVLSGVDERVAAIEAVMGGDDADKAINKVSEIITFLSGIEEGTVAKDTFDAVTAHGTAITNLQNNTVNGKKISENPVLAASDVLLTGYAAQSAAPLAVTDTINVALGKLEARVDAAAAGGVQSVGGKAGSITLDTDATGEGNVKFAISDAGEISATVNIGATAAQGALADSAIQSITNTDGFITPAVNGTTVNLEVEAHLSTNTAAASDAALATSALAKKYADAAEANAKGHADTVADTAYDNACTYADEQIAAALTWVEFD